MYPSPKELETVYGSSGYEDVIGEVGAGSSRAGT